MRAILSVYDKTGIDQFARGLHDLGWELFSTGKTQAAIAEAGVPVTSVADLTGSPEMLGGRVKTLHPKVHGGLLFRRGHAQDTADMEQHDIEPIDMVVGNLYPFVATVTEGDVTLAAALEEIDIGGPTMIRAAAKNHPWVIPVVDPADYEAVLDALRSGGLDDDWAPGPGREGVPARRSLRHRHRRVPAWRGQSVPGATHASA